MDYKNISALARKNGKFNLLINSLHIPNASDSLSGNIIRFIEQAGEKK